MQNHAAKRDTVLNNNAPIPDATIAEPLAAEVLKAHPLLPPLVLELSRSLLDRYSEAPRLCRALGSHQRWLLSQAACTLYFEYDPEDPKSGLTVGRLRDLITRNAAASRNTVLNFIEEMRHYRFVTDMPQQTGSRGRRRLMAVAAEAEEALRDWLAAHLDTLDRMDNGTRVQALIEDPGLLRRAQPGAARACIEDPSWANPPGQLGIFEWTDGGGLVMDELIVRAGLTPPDADGRVSVGPIKLRKFSEDYLMSHTHLQRVFRTAAEAGVLGWSGPRRQASLWIAHEFIVQYRHWQAVKLSYIDRAFRLAQRAAASSREGQTPCL